MIPDLCRICTHMKAGPGIFDQEPEEGPGIGIMMGLQFRCMKELKPIDGHCHEYEFDEEALYSWKS